MGQGGDVLWRSLDQGGAWAAVGNPGRVKVDSLAGYGDHLWVATEAGGFLSDDGGRSWRLPPAMQAAENSTWPAGPVELGADGTVVVGPGWAGDDAYWLSADAGRSGSMRRLPALALTGISAIAFRDREHGLALGGLTLGGGDGCAEATMLATSDGGAIWHHQGSLGMTVVSVAYNGSLAVAAGSACRYQLHRHFDELGADMVGGEHRRTFAALSGSTSGAWRWSVPT